jgi:hypothetical protein
MFIFFRYAMIYRHTYTQNDLFEKRSLLTGIYIVITSVNRTRHLHSSRSYCKLLRSRKEQHNFVRAGAEADCVTAPAAPTMVLKVVRN